MKKILMTLLAVLSLSSGLTVCSCTDEIQNAEKKVQDWKIALNNKVRGLETLEELAKAETEIKEIIKGHSKEEVEEALDKSIPDFIREGIIAFLTSETFDKKL